MHLVDKKIIRLLKWGQLYADQQFEYWPSYKVLIKISSVRYWYFIFQVNSIFMMSIFINWFINLFGIVCNWFIFVSSVLQYSTIQCVKQSPDLTFLRTFLVLCKMYNNTGAFLVLSLRLHTEEEEQDFRVFIYFYYN